MDLSLFCGHKSAARQKKPVCLQEGLLERYPDAHSLKGRIKQDIRMHPAPIPMPSPSEFVDLCRMLSIPCCPTRSMRLGDEDWLGGLFLPQLSLSKNLGIPTCLLPVLITYTSFYFYSFLLSSLHFFILPTHFSNLFLEAHSWWLWLKGLLINSHLPSWRNISPRVSWVLFDLKL